MNKLKYIMITSLMLLSTGALIPYILPLTDRSSFTGDYRIPYSMGEDYFLYNSYSKQIASEKTIPVIGDSVIWGHYTGDRDTLTAQLNSLNTKIKFTNMGLDGIHPAAMNGLMNLYSAKFKNRKIIAGVNLLWMSSPRHDLTGPANNEINHKILLPQFFTKIPSYQPSFEEKVSSLITGTIPLFSWIDHIRINRFAEKSFYLWTMENPHENIMKYFSRNNGEFKVPEGMHPDKMQEQDIEWIKTDKSLQWKFMIDTLTSLKNDGNEVAALITPFNTYMMTEKSKKEYSAILAEMEWILREKGITPVIPSPLEKKYFADSSHPTAEGYKVIAGDMMKDREFLEFLAK